MTRYCVFSIRPNNKLALTIPFVSWRALYRYHAFPAQICPVIAVMSVSTHPKLSMVLPILKGLLRFVLCLVSKCRGSTSLHSSELPDTVVEKPLNYDSNVMTEKTNIASLLDLRTTHFVGKFTSRTSDQLQYHLESGYRDGDLDTNENFVVYAPAYTPV